MNLDVGIQAAVRAYVNEELTRDDLTEWLDDHVQDIADAGGTTRGLADRVWSLFAELDNGHGDEATVRSELSRLVTRVRVSQPSWSIAPQTAAQHVNVAIETKFTPRAPRVVVWPAPIPHATTSGAAARP